MCVCSGRLSNLKQPTLGDKSDHKQISVEVTPMSAPIAVAV